MVPGLRASLRPPESLGKVRLCSFSIRFWWALVGHGHSLMVSPRSCRTRQTRFPAPPPGGWQEGAGIVPTRPGGPRALPRGFLSRTKGGVTSVCSGDLSLFPTVHSPSFGSGLTLPIFMGPSLPVSLHAKCLGSSDSSSARIGSPGPLPSPPTQVVAEQAVATSPAALFSPLLCWEGSRGCGSCLSWQGAGGDSLCLGLASSGFPCSVAARAQAAVRFRLTTYQLWDAE